uniref:Aldedh domain-containing protein n=1 Tax=Globodera pallida TaxID=36090 RepID=A0A183CED3_GLOPA
MGSVTSACKTVGTAVGTAVGAAVVAVAEAIIIPAVIYFAPDFFARIVSRCAYAVMSSYEIRWPPISFLLHEKGKVGVIGSMSSAIKSQNANAIERIGEELDAVDMGYIKDAFVKAAESKMMCYRCKQKVEYIDDLCYCEISDTKCHHGTTCCYRRKIQPVTY